MARAQRRQRGTRERACSFTIARRRRAPAASRIFLAKKKHLHSRRQVDLRGGEHLRLAFRAIIADGTPPLLVLDDDEQIPALAERGRAPQ
jgi:glutathione S-transferase